MAPTSTAQKLLIKPNTSVWLSDPSQLVLLGELPEGVSAADRPRAAAVSVIFAESAAHLRSVLDAFREELTETPVLWIGYRKANRADINRDTLWPILAEYGLRPITQVAVDEEWSALRFRPLKPGEKPFTGGA